jgi:hypothetical protein
MPKLTLETGTVIDLYGTVHVAEKLTNDTEVDLHESKVVRVTPAGRYHELTTVRVLRVDQNDQPGSILFRNPELPLGKEEIVQEAVQIGNRGKTIVILPTDPD